MKNHVWVPEPRLEPVMHLPSPYAGTLRKYERVKRACNDETVRRLALELRGMMEPAVATYTRQDSVRADDETVRRLEAALSWTSAGWMREAA